MIATTDRWSLWENVGGRYVLRHENATYNHATGFLYRAQRYGKPNLTVFDIQRTLRQDSGARVRHCMAVRNDWSENYRTPALGAEAFHIWSTAGTFD